jgi:hypothetical protein
MAAATKSLVEELCINSIRFLAIDAVEKSQAIQVYRWAQRQWRLCFGIAFAV